MSWFSDAFSSAGDIFKPFEFGYDVFSNERNMHYQRQQWQYQKDLQQQIFAREDNAVQRRAADLKAAGFNPLLAAGGAAGTGQAVTASAPNVPGLKTSYADYMIAKAKADADVSMTKAQQELLNDQATGVRLNNELTRKTIKWYDDHPGFAPGVETGLYTGKGLASGFDAFVQGVQSSRLGSAASWLGEKYAHATKQKPDPQYDKVYNYHLKQGLSPKEADRRARKFVGKK